MDSRLFCWARVRCPNGDPIYINVAQNGVTVKRSKLGLLGAQLFFEKDLHAIGQICTKLLPNVAGFDALPSGMTNPTLMLFTQLCAQCETALEASQLLNSGR